MLLYHCGDASTEPNCITSLNVKQSTSGGPPIWRLCHNLGARGNTPCVCCSMSLKRSAPVDAGGLPSQWSALSALQSLDVSNNKLTGPLPSSWSALSNLQVPRLHE